MCEKTEKSGVKGQTVTETRRYIGNIYIAVFKSKPEVQHTDCPV